MKAQRAAWLAGLGLAGAAAPLAPAAARPAATGFFAEGGLGAGGPVGGAADDARVGPTVALRVGRDLAPWLALGVSAEASTHEATVPPPPVGQFFQLYRGGLELRVVGRLDRLGLFAEAGAGGALISSNILEKVGVTGPAERASLALHAGAGLAYQLENRHYAVGAAGTVDVLTGFDGLALAGARLFLRYTY